MTQDHQPTAFDDGRIDAFFADRGVEMDAHRAVFETIRAAAILVAVMEERALRPLGLSHAGYRLLCELWIKGPLQPRDLAGFMMVSRPSIVGTIDTLQASALVERARSTEDRRQVTVALTDAGRRLVERADAAWHIAQEQVTATLDPAEKRRLAELTRRAASGALQLRQALALTDQPRA